MSLFNNRQFDESNFADIHFLGPRTVAWTRGYALLKANEDIPKQHLIIAVKYMKYWTLVCLAAMVLGLLGCCVSCVHRREQELCRTYRGRYHGYDSLSRVERDYHQMNGQFTPPDLM